MHVGNTALYCLDVVASRRSCSLLTSETLSLAVMQSAAGVFAPLHSASGPSQQLARREKQVMDNIATVFIVDDDEQVCRSLKDLIESIGISAVTFRNAADFLAAYDPTRPGCLVLDIRLQGASGLDVQRELAQRGIFLPIIIITAFADVRLAVNALKRGAVDFFEKPIRPDRIIESIRSAIDIDRSYRREQQECSQFDMKETRLTPREREVKKLMLDGLSAKQIAAKLDLSPKTAHIHYNRVLEKMDAESLAILVARSEFASAHSRKYRIRDKKSESLSPMSFI